MDASVKSSMISNWHFSEGTGSTTTDSVTGVFVPLNGGTTWARFLTCGDGTLQPWEQCDYGAGRNCSEDCVCARGTVMSSPPSVDCVVGSATPLDLSPVANPALDEDSGGLMWKVLIVVWLVALAIGGVYFFASKFWHRFLPPKVPTALIVKVQFFSFSFPRSLENKRKPERKRWKERK